jgi:predicted Fe-Mo cluster-binding NifX family protein
VESTKGAVPPLPGYHEAITGKENNMKIAITTTGEHLDSAVDLRFGRARGFIIYDDKSGDYYYIDNKQNLSAMQGAGVQSAKTVIDLGVGAVITGNVGPKAFTTLQAGNVEIYIGAEGSVNNVIDDYKGGKLQKTSGANVESHW